LRAGAPPHLRLARSRAGTPHHPCFGPLVYRKGGRAGESGRDERRAAARRRGPLETVGPGAKRRVGHSVRHRAELQLTEIARRGAGPRLAVHRAVRSARLLGPLVTVALVLGGAGADAAPGRGRGKQAPASRSAARAKERGPGASRSARPRVRGSRRGRGARGRLPRPATGRSVRAARARRAGRAGAARGRAPRIVRLPGARGARLSARLRAQLRATGYAQARVVIRTFERERLPIAARTGHDRTADSRLWDYPMDFSAATRRAAGIEDWQVTYAHEVDLRGGDPSILIPEGNE